MGIIEYILYIIVVLFYVSVLMGFYYFPNYNEPCNLYLLVEDFLCECKHINI